MLSQIPKSSFCIVGGEIFREYAKTQKHVDRNTAIISAHTMDYDRYLEEEMSSQKNIYGDYVVMLDEFGPYHPDYLNTDNEPVCNVETYYLQLNRFFGQLEEVVGVNVLIAAHHRYSYKMVIPFGGREIVVGRIVQLVKHAQLILAYASTSINYAVLYKVPLIFLTSSP